MKKIYCLSILVLVCIQCRSQKINLNDLENQLKKKAFPVKYENITLKNGSVSKLIISDSIWQNLVEKIIAKELVKKYCENNDCKVDLRFELGDSSEGFISLMQTIGTMFRLPRDIESIKFYNFIIYKNELYKIKLNRTTNIENRIKERLVKEKNGDECNYQIKNLLINLYFKDDYTYIHIYKDEICNAFIKIDLDESDLSFVKIENNLLE